MAFGVPDPSDLHERFRELPFFIALAAGEAPPVAVISWLRTLEIIHGALQRNLAGVEERGALAARNSAMLTLLATDLRVADALRTPSVTPAITLALDLAGDALALEECGPDALALFQLLDQTQCGAWRLREAYASCLSVGRHPARFSGWYGGANPGYARKTHQTDAAISGGGNLDGLIETWADRSRMMCSALLPYSPSDLRRHITAINYEAGDHAMPQTLRRLELALRAGQQAWDRWPYLEIRFGERGGRFTSSDSCWLAALLDAPPHVQTRNLSWLRGVLASRGIPTVVLEEHLRTIAALALAEFAELGGSEKPYANFFAKLERERASLCNPVDLDGLVQAYDQRLSGCSGRAVPSAAALLASAWVDEVSGMRGALSAIRDWLIDPLLFSKEWIAAIDDFMTALGQLEPGQC